jgi:hypothetical protein
MTCDDGVTTSTTLTDQNGSYSFAQMTAGRNIIITAALAGIIFANPSVSLPNLDSDKTGVDFVATAAPTPTPTPTPTPPPPGSVPSDPQNTGYSWVNCTKTLDAGVTTSADTISRTASGSGYGTSYAQCIEQTAYGTGGIAIRVNSSTDVIRFGLTNSGANNLSPVAITQPSQLSLTGPTYGIALTGSGNLQIWDQEAARMFAAYSCNGCIQPNDWLEVFSDEGTVEYYRDRGGALTLLYTTDHNAVGVSYPLLPQISFASSGSQAHVKILQPKPFGTNGTVFVATTGTKYGAGTANDPTTLTLATNGKRPVCDGSGNNDISIADGTYGPVNPSIVSGTPNNRCRFHATNISFPPAVTISASTNTYLVYITANYETWKDVALKNTSPSRTCSLNGSNSACPGQTSRNDGWRTDGTGNELINSTVDGAVNGVVSQTHGGTSIRGVITYNNGFAATDGGAGHGFYVHNDAGNARSEIKNSVSFGNYGLQLQFYNQNANQDVGYMDFDKVVTMNGAFWIVGQGPKTDINVSNAHVYKGGFMFGYADEVNVSGSVTNSCFYQRGPTLNAKTWAQFTFTGNKFVGSADGGGRAVAFNRKTNQPLNSYVFANNKYYRGLTGNGALTVPQFEIHNQDGSLQSGNTLASWQLLGFDTNSVFYNTVNEIGSPFGQDVPVRPSSTDVYVFPNTDQVGRAHIVIWNWPLASNVVVNLSSIGLSDGQKYDVYSIQSQKKLVSQAIYRTATPTVSLPMLTDDAPIARLGDASTTPPSTLPEFGVFIVIPR